MSTDDFHIVESSDSANISGQQEVLAFDVLFPPISTGHDLIDPVYMVLHGLMVALKKRLCKTLLGGALNKDRQWCLARGKCSRVDFKVRCQHLLLNMTPLLLSLFWRLWFN